MANGFGAACLCRFSRLEAEKAAVWSEVAVKWVLKWGESDWAVTIPEPWQPS